MRSVLLMIAIGLSDISASILKVNGLWEGSSDVVASFFGVMFLIVAAMDIVDFFRSK